MEKVKRTKDILLKEYLLKGKVPTDWVEIVEWNLTKKEAELLETELVEKYKPKFNKWKNPATFVETEETESLNQTTTS